MLTVVLGDHLTATQVAATLGCLHTSLERALAGDVGACYIVIEPTTAGMSRRAA